MPATENVASRTATIELPDSVTVHAFPEHDAMLTLELEHEFPEHDTLFTVFTLITLEESGSPGSPDEPLVAQALVELQHAVSTPSSRAGTSTYEES
jgi:hypothetical protein